MNDKKISPEDLNKYLCQLGLPNDYRKVILDDYEEGKHLEEEKHTLNYILWNYNATDEIQKIASNRIQQKNKNHHKKGIFTKIKEGVSSLFNYEEKDKEKKQYPKKRKFFRKNTIKTFGVGVAAAGLLYAGVHGVKNIELPTKETELVYTVERGDNLYEISKKFGGDEWRTTLEELTTKLGKDYPYSEDGKKWFSNGKHILTADNENPHYLMEKKDGEPKKIKLDSLDSLNENIEQKITNEQKENYNSKNLSGALVISVASLSTYLFLGSYNRRKSRKSTYSENIDEKVHRTPENFGSSDNEVYSEEDKAENYVNTDFSHFENDKKLQKKLDVYISYLGWWDNKFNRESKLFNNYSRYNSFNNSENLAKSNGIGKSTLYKHVNWIENKLINGQGDLRVYLNHKINTEYERILNGSKNKKRK